MKLRFVIGGDTKSLLYCVGANFRLIIDRRIPSQAAKLKQTLSDIKWKLKESFVHTLQNFRLFFQCLSFSHQVVIFGSNNCHLLVCGHSSLDGFIGPLSSNYFVNLSTMNDFWTSSLRKKQRSHELLLYSEVTLSTEKFQKSTWGGSLWSSIFDGLRYNLTGFCPSNRPSVNINTLSKLCSGWVILWYNAVWI